MKKLRTFAVSMIIAAIGLLIYCAGFYIKSYEQNLAARQEYAELSQMAGVKNREGAGLWEDACSTEKILYRNFLFGVVISISGHFFRNSGCS